MKRKILNPPFPASGIDQSSGYESQRPGTSFDLKNVRAYDPRTLQNRGAQRAGYSRYLSAQHSSSAPIQLLDHIVTPNSSALSGDVDTRVLTQIAVAGGNVKTFSGSAFSTPTSGGSALSSTVPFIFGAQLFGVYYMCDGTNYKSYTVSTDTVATWTASNGGTIPANSSDVARLICVWRGRIVLSGIKSDAHNWFMSKIGDPLDFDYSPDPTTPCDAVAGNNAPAGLVGDVVNTLIPWSDDLLLFGCDHSIWVMTGDPAAGGQLDRLSDITGMPFGQPWCKDPSGIIYFVGSQGGIFRMSPNGLPVRLTLQSIELKLRQVDLSNAYVRCVWNDREQGVNVFMTNLDGSASEHYFFDVRNEAWFVDTFSDADHNPTAVHTLDGDAPGDRVIILGTQDGYILKYDETVPTDDGDPIPSHVYIGPLRGKQGRKIMLDEIGGVMGQNTGAVRWEIFAGGSSESAYGNAMPHLQGYWRGGINTPERERVQGHSMYLKLSGVDYEHWSMERIDLGVFPLGESESRRYEEV